MRIGVDDDEQTIAGGRVLGEREQLRVVRRMELQRVVPLEGRVVAPDLIDETDELAKVARRMPVADANLILLRIEILLGSRAHRLVLTQLEAAVDTVIG